jgi:hypothetical protein
MAVKVKYFSGELEESERIIEHAITWKTDGDGTTFYDKNGAVVERFDAEVTYAQVIDDTEE